MHPAARFFAILKQSKAWSPLAVGIFSSLGIAAPPAEARPPRSERVINRAAERAYARASIAEVRAARAEARVAAIAPLVPVPPPPHPATVRRMRRAGVPLAGQPPLIVASAPTASPAGSAVLAGPALRAAPAPGQMAAADRPPLAATQPPRSVAPSIQPPQSASAQTEAGAGLAADGTRSVLASNQEPVAEAAAQPPAGLEAFDPPIELLPTPQPE